MIFAINCKTMRVEMDEDTALRVIDLLDRVSELDDELWTRANRSRPLNPTLTNVSFCLTTAKVALRRAIEEMGKRS